MGKLRKLLIALTLFLAGCSSTSNQIQTQKTLEREPQLPKNISLVSLEELVFDTEQRYKLPLHLESHINLRLSFNEIGNREQFEQDVYKTAEDLGYSTPSSKGL